EVFLNTQFEQIFSRHNALTKIYYLHPGFQVNYRNRYDQHRRLVKKVYTELDRSHPDSVEYRYFIK
ncbi:MAG: hypothetical protein Q8938_17035, partial [Bacteroidota bacterium]|nr:hypothetical protein [Bacteroidota bacterium]